MFGKVGMNEYEPASSWTSGRTHTSASPDQTGFVTVEILRTGNSLTHATINPPPSWIIGEYCNAHVKNKHIWVRRENTNNKKNMKKYFVILNYVDS